MNTGACDDLITVAAAARAAGAWLHVDGAFGLWAAASPATSGLVAAAVQQDGTCWIGATTWRGERLLRVSVPNWSTTEAEIGRSVEALDRASPRLRAEP